ncbi:uncharacterized protein LOC144597932 isoform X2 [Rhinoraja longicauda]
MATPCPRQEPKDRAMCLPLKKLGNLFNKMPETQNQAALQFIRNQVSKNCVVLFSKSYCPYCNKMKALFHGLGIGYKAIELDLRKDTEIMQNILEELTGARTVPRVFVNGKSIGGSKDTFTLHSKGKLLPLVERCSPPCT